MPAKRRKKVQMVLNLILATLNKGGKGRKGERNKQTNQGRQSVQKGRQERERDACIIITLT